QLVLEQLPRCSLIDHTQPPFPSSSDGPGIRTHFPPGVTSGGARAGYGGPMSDTYFVVVVEIPAGSRNKYEYDHESGAIFFGRLQSIEDMEAEARNEIEHFFSIYKDLEPGKRTSTRGWSGPEEALATIEDARRRSQAASSSRS